MISGVQGVAGIGHNGGPEMAGFQWRRHCWSQARARLLPVLPVEVVRLRVKRAQDLGLDYKTYAGVRAATGRDIIAFLFSSNALRLEKLLRVPERERERLLSLRGVGRLALAQSMAADQLLIANGDVLDGAGQAPLPMESFRATAERLRAVLGRSPGDAVVLVASDAPWERDWTAAGKLAAMIPAERFFTPAA
ncbi:hypothetical protein [Falsigemmobacter faecalis]|uniref:Uncharacterized protein n=1 Tax=Falsigemmobacter faecalis TaxID=2488730 RepID=A0A3P3DD15_9RHOB|nr:hypothetical protein [Falsigemmobacter faecalis]RRH72209.1 hypothetical protein EG244_15415 [Falsigemmobacter faecalis]